LCLLSLSLPGLAGPPGIFKPGLKKIGLCAAEDIKK